MNRYIISRRKFLRYRAAGVNYQVLITSLNKATINYPQKKKRKEKKKDL